LAVVCPGRDTACRSQGANGVERHCRAQNFPQGPGGPMGRLEGLQGRATKDRTVASDDSVGRARRSTSLGVQLDTDATANKSGGNSKRYRRHYPASQPHNNLANRRQRRQCWPRSAAVRQYSEHHGPTVQRAAGLRGFGPAFRYLSFNSKHSYPAILCANPITTAVQPWLAQECAYTFVPSNLHISGADGDAPV
jgi:hypothetical protein